MLMEIYLKQSLNVLFKILVVKEGKKKFCF